MLNGLGCLGQRWPFFLTASSDVVFQKLLIGEGVQQPTEPSSCLVKLGSSLRGGGGDTQQARARKRNENQLLSGLRELLSNFDAGPASPPAVVSSPSNPSSRPSKSKRKATQRASASGGLLGALQKLISRADGKDNRTIVSQLLRIVATAEEGKLHPGRGDVASKSYYAMPSKGSQSATGSSKANPKMTANHNLIGMLLQSRQ